MIKKVIQIAHNTQADDTVPLSWFDMQKPNLSALTQKNISFIMKVKFTHLHENDTLICDDGYRIKIQKSEDEIYIFEFKNHLDFARAAYEIGNRHQPICIEDSKITVLDDMSLADIVLQLKGNDGISVTKTQGYFKPNGKANHVH
ncbi:MAG: urease accessory protein [Sulfurimonas sp.]|jgi:urease accessory protein|uniref:urease accessory protein UreE n=1 Tax=Sulfurimonas sp. TaxID=2022749 RepID=UPI0039E3D1B9